jgi:CspA family cold shock protein
LIIAIFVACSVVRTKPLEKTGTVKWFNETKGFGFITPDDGTADVFVHYSSIDMESSRTLQEGQRVLFVVVESSKGRSAHHVRIVQNPVPKPAPNCQLRRQPVRGSALAAPTA